MKHNPIYTIELERFLRGKSGVIYSSMTVNLVSETRLSAAELAEKSYYNQGWRIRNVAVTRSGN